MGFSVDNIFELMPGDKIKTIDEFTDFIISINEGIDAYSDEREKVDNYVHDYKDCNNCERVLNQIGFKVKK